MALPWTTDPHSEVFDRNGQSITVDFIESATSGDRTYRLASGTRWGLALFVVVRFVTIEHFDTEADAKAAAEQWEADRAQRFAEGANFAQLKNVDAATEKGFGGLWADKYFHEGLTITGAWDDYESG